MFYKVLSANSLVELQNIVNEHINNGYQLQGGLVVTSTVEEQESGPINYDPGAPLPISGPDPQPAPPPVWRGRPDRWTAPTPGKSSITYLQAVWRQTVTFNPAAAAGESPHIKDN